jgi:LPXTG-motif cell wall-anchored protein
MVLAFVCALIPLIAVGQLSAVAAPPAGVGSILTLPAGGGNAQPPSIASSDDGSITAVVGTSTGGVVAERSTDGGATWSTPTRLSTVGVVASNGSVVTLDDGTLGATWQEASGASGVDVIRASRSLDSGLTWQPSLLVSTGTTIGEEAVEPSIGTAPMGSATITWSQRDTYGELHAHEALVFGYSGVAVVASPLGPHNDGDASYVKSFYDGQGHWVFTWVSHDSNGYHTLAYVDGHAPTELSEYPMTQPRPASIARTRDGVFVVVFSNPDSASSPHFNIVASSSFDFGATWSAPVCVSSSSASSSSPSPSPSPSSSPAPTCSYSQFARYPTVLTLANGNLLATWTLSTPGYSLIQSSQGDSTGQHWSVPANVSPSVNFTYHYVSNLVQEADGTLVSVWTFGSGGSTRVLLNTSHDNGSNWGDPLSITSDIASPGVSATTAIALRGGGVGLAWLQEETPNPSQALFRSFGWTSQPSPSSSGSSTPTATPGVASGSSTPAATPSTARSTAIPGSLAQTGTNVDVAVWAGGALLVMFLGSAILGFVKRRSR